MHEAKVIEDERGMHVMRWCESLERDIEVERVEAEEIPSDPMERDMLIRGLIKNWSV